MRYRAVLESFGGRMAGFEVPDDVMTALNSGYRPPITVTIGEYTFQTSAHRGDRRFVTNVSVENRAKAGIEIGDEVEIDVNLDTSVPEVTVPPDLAAALDADPEAKRRFEAMPFRHRKEYVMWIYGAKRSAMRQARVARSMQMIRTGFPKLFR